jgi:hypothetical protein
MSTVAALRRLNASGMLARRRICIAPSTSTISTRLIGVGHNSNYNRLSLSETNHVNSKYRRQFHSSIVVGKDDYPVHTVLPFPALSPTMETGTIASWELSEGDAFSAGSVLCSIETDKATMDYEAQDDGFIAKILKDGPDASDLPIGTPIAIVVEELEDVAAFADYVVLEDEDGSGVGGVSTSSADAPIAPSSASTTAALVVGGDSGTSFLLPSARFLAESKYVKLSFKMLMTMVVLMSVA